MKKIIFEKGVFHVFTKSIADYIIFRSDEDYRRMLELFKFYMFERKNSFSNYWRMPDNKKELEYKGKKIVKIIAYCLMPTHIHLIISNEIEKGIVLFMKNLLDSYSKYFNLKVKRKGPLWESRYKTVLVETDEQLLHLTRYIHLNPVTAYLINKPEEWKFSSYLEYLGEINDREKISEYEEFLEINPKDYKIFVENRISYQRELNKIKKLTFE
jgi:putative transposase